MTTVDIELFKLKFKEGDPDAGEKLLKAFRPLIDSFIVALWTGVGRTQETRTLLAYFSGSDKKSTLSDCLKKHYTYEDVVQTVKYCLLQTCKQYRVITKSLKYSLKIELHLMLKDVSTWVTCDAEPIHVMYDKQDRLVQTRPVFITSINPCETEIDRITAYEFFGEKYADFVYFNRFLDLTQTGPGSYQVPNLSPRQSKRFSSRVKGITTKLLD